MKSLMHDVTQFHNKYAQPVGSGKFGDDRLDGLRCSLIDEEAKEFRNAVELRDAAEALDALGDLIYVAVGAAVAYGWDLDEAWKRIQQSNMSKLGADGKPIHRDDGKVLKGPNFKPPVHDDLVSHNCGDG